MSEQCPKPRKKTNGRANRERGHRLERNVAAFFRLFLPNVVTSRQASRLRDSQGIDLCHTEELKFGQMPVTVQCKACCDVPPFVALLERIKEHPLPIVWWQKVTMLKISKKNTNGASRGAVGDEYVIMNANTFKTLLEGYFANEGIRKQSTDSLD
jgi:hypothetical protein